MDIKHFDADCGHEPVERTSGMAEGKADMCSAVVVVSATHS